MSDILHSYQEDATACLAAEQNTADILKLVWQKYQCVKMLTVHFMKTKNTQEKP